MVQPFPNRVNRHVCIFSLIREKTSDKRLRCHLQASSQQGAPLCTLHLLTGLIQIWQNLSISRIQPDTTPEASISSIFDVTPFWDLENLLVKSWRGQEPVLKWTKRFERKEEKITKEFKRTSEILQFNNSSFHRYLLTFIDHGLPVAICQLFRAKSCC